MCHWEDFLSAFMNANQTGWGIIIYKNIILSVMGLALQQLALQQETSSLMSYYERNGIALILWVEKEIK